MNTPKFPVGTVVYLKSGSPKLTVIYNNNEGLATVAWIEGLTATQQSFPETCLTQDKPQ